MKHRTFHRWALTASVAFPTIGVMNGSALLAVAGALLLALLFWRGGRLLDVERTASFTTGVHVVTALLLAAAVVTFPRSRVDAVLIVVMLGIFNRFLLRAGQRDDMIVVGASGVLMAASTTITPGIAFVPIISGYVVCSLWALWASMVLGIGEGEPAARRAATIQRLGDRREQRPLFRIAAFGVLFMLLGSAVMAFFPRFHFGRYFSAGYFMSLPGQSDEMELTTGGVTNAGGGAVALRIEPAPGRSGASLEGLYAQMNVLDYFDGRRFTARIEDRGREFFLYPAEYFYHGPEDRFVPGEDGPNVLRVTLPRRKPRSSPHPVATVGWDRPGYVEMLGVRQRENGSIIRGPGHPGTQFVYKVDPDREYEPMLVPDHDRRFLQLPDRIDRRIVDLAERLTKGEETRRGKVQAILRHFDRGFEYSLAPLEGEAEDPLVRFLFEAKRGHCELYAGAVVVLLRLAGVPSRVATGYYGGWWNSPGGYLELSEADAHAWVEVWDGEWRWVDATPAELRLRRREKSFAWILDFYDAAEAFWHNRIVEFDEKERQRLVGGLTARFEEVRDVGIGSPGDLRTSGGGGSAGVIAAIVVLLALAGAGVHVVSLRRRRRRPEALGARLRRALGAEGNRTLGALLSGVDDAVRAEARTAVEAYERLRFGPAKDAPSAADVEANIRGLERATRGRPRA